jgi:hypothetical protein
MGSTVCSGAPAAKGAICYREGGCMSHVTTVKTAIRDLSILQAACQRMGLQQPRYVDNYVLGAGRRATGHAVQLPGWYKPVVFDLASGEKLFDNYSPYTEAHPDVVSGTRRIGENGNWGSLEELDRFENHYALAALQQTADQLGHQLEYREIGNNIEFEIHVSA